jgi:dTMP kinase
MINSYLSGQSEQEDHVIHLLFSANRWEAASVKTPIAVHLKLATNRCLAHLSSRHLKVAQR